MTMSHEKRLEWIKKFIKLVGVAQGCSEEEARDNLADMLGVSPPTLRSWSEKNGRDAPLSVEELNNFALKCLELASTLINSPQVNALFKAHGFGREQMSEELLDKIGAEPPEISRQVENQLAGDFIMNSFNNAVTGLQDKAPNNLPTPHPAYIKRKQLQQEIVKQLKRYKILILSGREGIGKTTVANYIAHHLAGQYNDGKLWIDAQQNRSIWGIQTTIAQYFGIRLLGERLADREGELRSFFHTRKVLIVIDGIFANQDMDYLNIVRGQSRLIITTSDKKLGYSKLPAVWVKVDILNSEESLMMLPARVRDTVEAQELIDRTGRLPLALQLIRKLLEDKVLTLMEICHYFQKDQLDFEILDPSDTKLQDKGLRASFDLSYNRLKSSIGQNFAQLGCIMGVFDKPALQKIWGQDKKEIDKRLKPMLDLWLVESQWEGYYHLHPLLRHYARQKLEAKPDLQKDTQRRHAEHYLEFGFAYSWILFTYALELMYDSVSLSGPVSITPALDLKLGIIWSFYKPNGDNHARNSFFAITGLIFLLDFLELYDQNYGDTQKLRTSLRTAIDAAQYYDAVSIWVSKIMPTELILPEIVEALLWFREHAPNDLVDRIRNWAEQECKREGLQLPQEAFKKMFPYIGSNMTNEELNTSDFPGVMDIFEGGFYFRPPYYVSPLTQAKLRGII